MKPRKSSLVLLILAAAACGGGPPPQTPAAPPRTPWPPPVPLYFDNTGGIRDSVRVVITHPDSLEKYWTQATSTQTAPPPVPPVDFSQDMAILVAAGVMTPNDRVQVDSLHVREETRPDGEKEETMTIFVSTLESCRRFQSDAFPVAIFRARKFLGPVKWNMSRPVPVCRDER